MRTRYLLASIVGGAVGVAIGGWITYEEFFVDEPIVYRTWADIDESDTLRVVTVSSSISAFEYKNGWRGHEYEMIQQVAGELGLQMKIILASSESAMLDSVSSGAADLAVWPTCFSVARNHGNLRPCGYTYEQGLVPVFRQGISLDSMYAEPLRLVVREGGRASLALQDEYVLSHFSLDPYEVVTVPDTLTSESLTEQVINGDYDVALIATNLAQLLRTYYDNLKLGRPLIDSEDSVAWVVSIAADTLAAKIDSVCRYERSAPRYATLAKRYYERSLGRSVKIRYLLGDGRLSVYDPLFKKYSTRLGWDWRLLAAVSFIESRFDPHEISGKGARGLMQLMPGTALAFGCPSGLVTDPEANVQAGARLIESLEQSLRGRIARKIQPELTSYSQADPETKSAVEKDLVYFTLASYNAGLAHIYDAIDLADSLGYDPAVWEDNVEACLQLKSDSAYYNLPIVKHGRFGARVTINYVSEVLETYAEFCKIAKKN